MDELLGEFENLKISALSKSKSINKYVCDVTIGPNSSNIEKLNHNSPKKREKQKLSYVKTPVSNNKHTSVGKILTVVEAEIKDEIATSIKTRLEKIQDAGKALHARAKSEWLQKQKMLIAQSQEQEELMLKVLEEHDRKAIDHLQQLQIQQQKQAEERNKRNLELQVREKLRKDINQTVESIQKQHMAFRVLYQDMVILIKENYNASIIQDPKKQATFSGITTKLKALLENIEKIKEICKAQSLELNKNLTNELIAQINTEAKANLEDAVLLVTDISILKENLQQFITSCKEDERREKQKAEAAAAAAAANIPPPQETKVIPSAPSNSIPNYPQMQTSVSSSVSQTTQQPQIQQQNHFQQQNHIPQQQLQQNSVSVTTLDSFANKNALKEYANLQQFLENYKKQFTDLISNTNLKQFRFSCQKAVNIPLNSISAVNSHHLLDKYNRLSNLLRGHPVEAGGSTVSSSQHPQGVYFCTDLLARKFVMQGDLLISSNPESAHGYAAVLVALAHDFPDFAKLVLAYFYQTAPYLVPFYPPKLAGQTDREYYETLGYLYSEDVVEKQDKFLKRMSGTMRLYAAFMCSRLKRGQQGSHPHGLLNAWKWLANVLNMEPRSDITAALISEFLEVTGNSMQAAYRNQFQKLLIYINDVYLDKMQKIDSGGPVTRLIVFLQKVKKANGIIEPPKGRLSENFW